MFLEQLYTFGAPHRDPRGRVISVAYYALVSAHLLPKVEAGDDAAEVQWLPVNDALQKKLAFDHNKIVRMTLVRIQGRADYDPRIAAGLLPTEFSQAEFRRIHEVIMDRSFDRGNFSKKFRRMMENGSILPASGRRILRGAGRPPKLYTFSGASS